MTKTSFLFDQNYISLSCREENKWRVGWPVGEYKKEDKKSVYKDWKAEKDVKIESWNKEPIGIRKEMFGQKHRPFSEDAEVQRCTCFACLSSWQLLCVFVYRCMINLC